MGLRLWPLLSSAQPSRPFRPARQGRSLPKAPESTLLTATRFLWSCGRPRRCEAQHERPETPERARLGSCRRRWRTSFVALDAWRRRGVLAVLTWWLPDNIGLLPVQGARRALHRQAHRPRAGKARAGAAESQGKPPEDTAEADRGGRRRGWRGRVSARREG